MGQVESSEEIHKEYSLKRTVGNGIAAPESRD